MKSWKGLAYVSIVALLSLFLRANATSQVQKAEGPNPSGLPSTKTPEHPITEEQLRTLFEVTHLLSVNRQLIHEKLEAQRRQMPEWYPQSVWDEIADAVENIDLAAVALPAYQKCISEDDAKFVITFVATPQGQKLTQTFLLKQAQAQQEGMAPVKAYDQARAELARHEDAEVERILASVRQNCATSSRVLPVGSRCSQRCDKCATKCRRPLGPSRWSWQGQSQQNIDPNWSRPSTDMKQVTSQLPVLKHQNSCTVMVLLLSQS